MINYGNYVFIYARFQNKINPRSGYNVRLFVLVNEGITEQIVIDYIKENIQDIVKGVSVSKIDASSNYTFKHLLVGTRKYGEYGNFRSNPVLARKANKIYNIYKDIT